ncbi:hypothetical protein PR048_031077 [Dryococelus australis]|uniref:Glutaredoxin domain-containing protein n=1 Tax=Dryococelus australis TaxID=614101 RepID=A0ABQ9G488_9NEOP|nr:hypothetical protein PR048_031077 [Dryococelus australis]
MGNPIKYGTVCNPIPAKLLEVYVIPESIKSFFFAQEVKFAKCLAEDIPEVSMNFGITAVPTFLLLRGGSVVDRVDGADSATLARKIKQQAAKVSWPTVKPAVESEAALTARLKHLISTAPVMLFMKGSPEQPRCGFSKTIIALLKELNADYGTFDILSDEAVRQGLKKYSDWPTYPQVRYFDVLYELSKESQMVRLSRVSLLCALKKPDWRQFEFTTNITNFTMLMIRVIIEKPLVRLPAFHQGKPGSIPGRFTLDFWKWDLYWMMPLVGGFSRGSPMYVNGELIGGLDIVREMKENGELEKMLPKKQTGKPSENGVASLPDEKLLEERLKGLINSSEVMVFMKGDRNTPRCGFSRQLMEILTETGYVASFT